MQKQRFCKRGHDTFVTGRHLRGYGCKVCANERRQERKNEGLALANKIKLEKGCLNCGYKAHAAALHLHHRDPASKRRAVSTLLHNSEIGRALTEIEKCDVLCANCHAIEHPRTPKGTL